MPLKLVRKKDETIVITTPQGEMTITVASISPSKVGLVFSNPSNLKVWRGEVVEKMKKEDK